MRLTDADLAAGALEPERLELLVAAFYDTGLVALENAVPVEIVTQMREALHAARATNGHYCPRWEPGSDTSFVGCTFFEWEAPFNAPEFVAHPILLQLADAIIGDAVCRIYNTNLSSPNGTHDQQIHVDVPSVTDEGALRTTPLMSVQLNLCDFTEANGSTRLWPATHRIPMRKEFGGEIARRAAEYPSVRANYPAGTIWIRHPSAWHQGMANRTSEWREMLSVLLAPREAPYDTQVFERELCITPDQLDALPDRARSIWNVNLTAGVHAT